MPNFRIISEEELVLLAPKMENLKSAVPFKNVRNKTGFVLSFNERVDL